MTDTKEPKLHEPTRELEDAADAMKARLGIAGISLKQARANYGASAVCHARTAVLKLLEERFGDKFTRACIARVLGL